MKKYIYNSLVGLVTAFLLMLSLQVAGQNKELLTLQNSVENYTKNNLQEKIYVHTDKNFYVANEICWFKIYNVDAIFNKPLNISKVAYVELIDNNNKAVWQEKIALNDKYFIDKKLYPNVDFYSGIILRAMGFPPEMFTVIFSIARSSGWTAHWHEMIEDPVQKSGRPRQLYLGNKKSVYGKKRSTKNTR